MQKPPMYGSTTRLDSAHSAMTRLGARGFRACPSRPFTTTSRRRQACAPFKRAALPSARRPFAPALFRYIGRRRELLGGVSATLGPAPRSCWRRKSLICRPAAPPGFKRAPQQWLIAAKRRFSVFRPPARGLKVIKHAGHRHDNGY